MHVCMGSFYLPIFTSRFHSACRFGPTAHKEAGIRTEYNKKRSIRSWFRMTDKRRPAAQQAKLL